MRTVTDGRGPSSSTSTEPCNRPGWNDHLEYFGYNTAAIPPHLSDYDLSGHAQNLVPFPEPDASLSLDAICRSIFPFKHFLTTATGRLAESHLTRVLTGQKKIIAGGQRLSEAIRPLTAMDLTYIDLSAKPDLTNHSPVQRNIDLSRLSRFLDDAAEALAFVCIEPGSLTTGGSGISLENLKQVQALLQRYHIPLILDATHILESASSIGDSDPDYQHAKTWDIVRSICAHSDGLFMNLSGSFPMETGGLIALDNESLAIQIQEALTLEGGVLHHSANTNLTSILKNRDWILQQTRQRLDQTAWLAKKLKKAELPIHHTFGPFILFDVDELPWLGEHKHPLPSFLAWLYKETGIKASMHRLHRNTYQEMARLCIPIGLEDASIEDIAARIKEAFSKSPNLNLECIKPPHRLLGEKQAEYRPLLLEQTHAESLTLQKAPRIQMTRPSGNTRLPKVEAALNAHP